jgi:hypothetical protein
MTAEEPLEIYRRRLWAALESVGRRPMMDISIGHGQRELRKRMAGGDAFDGGRTQRWMEGLGAHATWRSVSDRETAHTIHIVSDRPAAALSRELHEGLRLLAWLSPRPVTWYWWDQPWVRRLPAGADPGRDHINGGWAVPGIPEVHVYRREEALKVMLHEAIHGLSLDVRAEMIEPVRRVFEKTLGRRLWPHLGEAFTEFFAEWLWAIGRSQSLVEARRRWAAQMKCATTQAGQVWARIRDSREDEDTNIFAYMILKWVLMAHSVDVLMDPNDTVQHWFKWWTEKLPELESTARRVAHTESESIPLGMTCPTDR